MTDPLILPSRDTYLLPSSTYVPCAYFLGVGPLQPQPDQTVLVDLIPLHTACSRQKRQIRASLNRLPTIASIFTRLFGSFAASSSPAMTSAAKTKAQNIINENGVVVFSKTWCPYCKATKNTLSETGAKYYVMELDEVEDGSAIQDALEELTHQRSVPNIFINRQHIGGNSDLQARKAELPKLLKEAGAL
ncbi:hypothetical protein VTN00DRAFT_2297 [Thermoascus crustaceus]|uniref:uncharacterized protein n=1 Tax=Thermoascus crustaceus TaxID=5088 RepID=UPI0037420F9F